MTPQQLQMLAGLALSLALAYAPGVRERYEALSPAQKVAVLGGLLILAAAGSLGASCAGLVAWVTCDKDGAVGLIAALVNALIASQAGYTMFVRPFKDAPALPAPPRNFGDAL